MSDVEDAAIEGFFAKKDKTKKPKKQGKKKTKSETVITQSENKVTQVDEWKDFEEEKEKDYSNLKMADLQIGEEVEREVQVEQQNNDETDGGNNEEDDSGIWKTSQQQPQKGDPVPAPVKTLGSHNVANGKYVPPSMKRAAAAGAGQPITRRRQGAPPDIKSQAAFPTLSASSDSMPSDFEMVKRGMRNNEPRVGERPQLDLGNRYDGLRS